MKKLLAFTIYTFVLIFVVANFAYKRGAHDFSATTTYTNAANRFVTLYMLRNKTNDESLKFFESNLAFDIAIHRSFAENRSVLFGLLNIGQHKPNTEYYKEILDYINKHPNDAFDKNVINDIKWLVENEQKIF